jgi:hypothetical protein
VEHLINVIIVVISIIGVVLSLVGVGMTLMVKDPNKSIVGRFEDYMVSRKYPVDSYWFLQKDHAWSFTNTVITIKLKRVNRNGVHYINCSNLESNWMDIDILKEYYKRVPPEDEGMVALMTL